MSALVRKARAEDVESLGRMGAALARLHHQFDPPRFMLPDGVEAGYRTWLAKELGHEDAVVLVATLEGAVVGYAYGRLEERDWNDLLDRHGGFHDLWVEAAARRHGVGELLAEAMMEALKALGAPRVVLKTAAPNQTAQDLFAKLGWRPTMIEMTKEA